MAPSGMTILTPDSGEDRTPPWEVNLPRAVATTCVSSSWDPKSLLKEHKRPLNNRIKQESRSPTDNSEIAGCGAMTVDNCFE